MIQYQAGKLLDTLSRFRETQFSGILNVNPKGAPEGWVLIFKDGQLTYAGKVIPTPQTLSEFLKVKLRQAGTSNAGLEASLKQALQRLKNPNSTRELLDFMNRFQVWTWENIEAAIRWQVVLVLEKLMPHPGTIQDDPATRCDIAYGTDGHALDWSRIEKDVSRRRRLWEALAPAIPSMYAKPRPVSPPQPSEDLQASQHIQTWINGQRTILEIAEQVDRDPLDLAHSYLQWIKAGWIGFDTGSSNSVAPRPAATGSQPAASQAESDELRPVVLSVDDSPIVQKMIERAIGNRYTVLLANNAMDALSLLNRNSVSVLLLDVTMPDIDGIELCRTIRKIQRFQTLPIVMLTAKDGFLDKMKGQMAGTNYYLTKPVDPEALLSTIDQCLVADRVFRE